MLTQGEIGRIAPNLGRDMLPYLLRPTPCMSEPPLCTLHELRTIYTLDDLADFHEVLDLREAAGEKATRVTEREAQARSRGRR
ncbi:hypothetical protein [Methylobacterium sp. 37f]|uniref:hypothetical protein n=1 Tax=Methylobacterium sp. 37f TaxID=2817058 RepID=UPI001FFDEAE4|nr:hypothetical protein [Methylobacterium sp. 37f]MCK2056923.1 hypothetical protein [Methylobacterium sp. 37f]